MISRRIFKKKEWCPQVDIYSIWLHLYTEKHCEILIPYIFNSVQARAYIKSKLLRV